MKKATAVIKAPVSEIFFSHQGEGVCMGEPQVFVRFVGCNLRCDYCDTADNQIITENQKYYSVEDILGRVKKLSGGKPCTVSLTGGEPLLYARYLARLLPALKKQKYKTYLETNGTLPELFRTVARWVDVVSMDVKVPSACRAAYWGEHRAFLAAAGKKAFVKLVITDATTIEEAARAGAVTHAASPAIPLVLQIASTVKKCAAPAPAKIFLLTQAARKKHPHSFACPQMHKIWSVR